MDFDEPVVSVDSSKISAQSSATVQWRQSNLPATTDPINTATFGKGVFVAAAGQQIYYSRDDITWFIGARYSVFFRKIVYGNDIFVAITSGTGSNNLYVSNDGINFSFVTTNIRNTYIYNIRFLAGRFVALISGPSLGFGLAVSDAGISWTSRNYIDVTSITPVDLTWDGSNLIVYAIQGGTATLLTTNNDGLSWARVGAPASLTVSSSVRIVYGKGVYVLAGEDLVTTNSIGGTWTTQLMDVDSTCLIFDGDDFYLGSNTGEVWTSSDGITWQLDDTLSEPLLDIQSSDVYYITAGQQGYVAVKKPAFDFTEILPFRIFNDSHRVEIDLRNSQDFVDLMARDLIWEKLDDTFLSMQLGAVTLQSGPAAAIPDTAAKQATGIVPRSGTVKITRWFYREGKIYLYFDFPTGSSLALRSVDIQDSRTNTTVNLGGQLLVNARPGYSFVIELSNNVDQLVRNFVYPRRLSSGTSLIRDLKGFPFNGVLQLKEFNSDLGYHAVNLTSAANINVNQDAAVSFVEVSEYGNSGEILISRGPNAAPEWASPPGKVTKIIGGPGVAVTPPSGVGNVTISRSPAGSYWETPSEIQPGDMFVGAFIGVRAKAGKIYPNPTSEPGFGWNPSPAAYNVLSYSAGAGIRSAESVGNKILLVYRYGLISSDDNGQHWNHLDDGGRTNWEYYYIRYFNGVYYAWVTRRFITSTDAITWTPGPVVETSDLIFMDLVNGWIFASFNSGRSYAGTNIDDLSLITPRYLTSVVFNSDSFYALSAIPYTRLTGSYGAGTGYQSVLSSAAGPLGQWTVRWQDTATTQSYRSSSTIQSPWNQPTTIVSDGSTVLLPLNRVRYRYQAYSYIPPVLETNGNSFILSFDAVTESIANVDTLRIIGNAVVDSTSTLILSCNSSNIASFPILDLPMITSQPWDYIADSAFSTVLETRVSGSRLFLSGRSGSIEKFQSVLIPSGTTSAQLQILPAPSGYRRIIRKISDDLLAVNGPSGYVFFRDSQGWLDPTAQPYLNQNNLNIISVTATDTISAALSSGTESINQQVALGTGTDLQTWSLSDTLQKQLADITSDGTDLVSVGNTGLIIKGTVTGTTVSWQTIASGTVSDLTRVRYIQSRYYALGSAGTILNSSDGLSWFPSATNTSLNATDITYGNNIYLATFFTPSGTERNLVQQSNDGEIWEPCITQLGSRLANVFSAHFNQGSFIVAGGEAGQAYISQDLRSWTQITSIAGTLTYQDAAVIGNVSYLVGTFPGVIESQQDLPLSILKTSSNVWDSTVPTGNYRCLGASTSDPAYTSMWVRIS